MIYMKFFGHLLAAVLAGILPRVAAGPLTPADWVNVLIILLGSIAVLGAGNLPDGVWKYTKAIVSAATAGAVCLASLINGPLGTTQYIQIALAVLGAAGVYGIPGPQVTYAGVKYRTTSNAKKEL